MKTLMIVELFASFGSVYNSIYEILFTPNSAILMYLEEGNEREIEIPLSSIYKITLQD